ncbi:hypothetical protein ACFOMD_00520 [Sphingoaurantiacus capsulatus]|uniref:Uncharacterized protein n=1 Tax=Sphingoaurantiacus capsulatus TaxID=1771310 RepID=A0ABV7X4E5_9SPHN
MFNAIASFLRGQSGGFTPYEQAILDAVAQALDEPLRAKFEARVAAITDVRRRDSGKAIATEQRAGGKLLFPEETRLTAADGDVMLARFNVNSRATLSSLQGQVWLLRGNLSSLTFTQPTEHAEVDDIHRISVKIDDGIAAEG